MRKPCDVECALHLTLDTFQLSKFSGASCSQLGLRQPMPDVAKDSESAKASECAPTIFSVRLRASKQASWERFEEDFGKVFFLFSYDSFSVLHVVDLGPRDPPEILTKLSAQKSAPKSHEDPCRISVHEQSTHKNQCTTPRGAPPPDKLSQVERHNDDNQS